MSRVSRTPISSNQKPVSAYTARPVAKGKPVVSAPVVRLTVEQLQEKYDRLRIKLGLEGTIWADIDPDLLLLAFIHRSAVDQIPDEILDRMEDKYVATDYEWHEFIGDGVLKMLGTTLVTELGSIEYLSQAHVFRQELDRNTTLYCYMNQKGLCSEIIKDQGEKFGYKMCADMLEAVFGVLYWWGYYVKGLGYGVLQPVRDWYLKTWPVRESLDQLFDGGKVRCGISESGHGPFTEWSPCDGVAQEQYRTAPCIDPMNCQGPLNETRPCPVVPQSRPVVSQQPRQQPTVQRNRPNLTPIAQVPVMAPTRPTNIPLGNVGSGATTSIRSNMFRSPTTPVVTPMRPTVAPTVNTSVKSPTRPFIQYDIPPILREPYQPVGFLARPQYNRLNIFNKRTQLDHEIGMLLKSPLVKGEDREFLLRTRPILTGTNTSLGDLRQIKDQLTDIASKVGLVG